VESRLGRVLSTTDLKILYRLYDYLSLSEEVIPLLITYCTEECRLESNKEGRMPGMRQIEREAYSWRRQGVDTPERAVEHIKAQRARRSRQGRILEALGIEGRTPVPSERRYIDEWIDMGFSAEAVSIAFDRTVLKTGGLKWPYLNSILKSWHQKGLHTPEEIETGDSASPSAAQPRKPADSAASDREAIAWMREYVKNKRVGDAK
jgi:DnaD/phage-associated family protein